MKKKHHKFTEHYLVPGVLFLINICLAHLIYVLAAGTMYSLISKIALTAALTLLIGSLLLRKKLLIVGSILFYSLVVFWV